MADEAKQGLFEEYTALFTATGALEGCADSQNITADDTLIVVDMQDDFLPEADAPKGGRFGVADGAAAAAEIVKLIEKFTAAGAKVVATRDYHPIDHCSFSTQSGPFPPHCVQGSDGSKFFAPIGAALSSARDSSDNVSIVFKGFSEEIDSFGAFPYSEESATGRLSHCGQSLGCSVGWTGGFGLKMSNIGADINAPPDVMAILNKKSLKQVLLGSDGEGEGSSEKRLFVCGLAFDFCVLDTALNAARGGFSNVVMVFDAARAAHIPGVGSFGSGFLSDPAGIAQQAKEAGVQFTSTASCLA